MVLQRSSNKCLVILPNKCLCTDVILVNRYSYFIDKVLICEDKNYRTLSVKVQQVVFRLKMI
jgi:hypothetical protein